MAEDAEQRPQHGPGTSAPSSRFPVAPVAIVFGGCVLLYGIAFGFIEHSRHRKGAWELSFVTDTAGVPSLRIEQPALGIHGVEIRFPLAHETPFPSRTALQLDKPARALPFGRRIHEDLTFLPGVIAMELFGHEVEIAPRTLVLDRKEVAWSPNLMIRLETPPSAPPKPQGGPAAGH